MATSYKLLKKLAPTFQEVAKSIQTPWSLQLSASLHQ